MKLLPECSRCEWCLAGLKSKIMRVAVGVDLLVLVLAVFLSAWLMIPRSSLLAQPAVPRSSLEVVDDRVNDHARRLAILESKAEESANSIAGIRSVGGTLLAVIAALTAFNAIKKFK